jgi:hypothetical protein
MRRLIEETDEKLKKAFSFLSPRVVKSENKPKDDG